MKKRLGDIPTRAVNPLETYYDNVQQGVSLPRSRWIVKPEWEPKPIMVPPGPGADVAQQVIAAQQQMFEGHVIPRMWQLLMDFWSKSQCGTYFTKRPDWVEPPVTGTSVEVVNETGTAVTGVTDTIICQSDRTPDRMVQSILLFGIDLSLAASWGDIIFTINVNDRPLRYYQDFRRQRGSVAVPATFGVPIVLNPGDMLELTARKSGAGIADTTVYARFSGFQFPAQSIDQSGTYRQYHSV